MSLQTHVSKQESALTVEWARAQVFAWLAARTGLGRSAPAAPSNQEKEELQWLGLDGEGEGEQSEAPPWVRTPPSIEETPSSAWGEWSGRTSLAELRELGVLPEALLNFLALQGWPVPREEEVLSREQLLGHLPHHRRGWPPQETPPQAAAFDFEQLRRINHAWIERAHPERLLELSLPYFRLAGWLPEGELAPVVRAWLAEVVRAVQPGLDFLSLLPARTRLVFDYQPEYYLSVPESRQVMESEGAREVLRAFGQRALAESWLTVERFHEILEEVKRETPWRGGHLLRPVRVALTGLPFGPSLDDLIPIFERGHELDLPVEVKSCRQRVLEFCSVFV